MTARATSPGASVTVGTEVDPAIRERLTAVYDPCCREKGISVVDMGLLHRATVDDEGRRASSCS